MLLKLPSTWLEDNKTCTPKPRKWSKTLKIFVCVPWNVKKLPKIVQPPKLVLKCVIPTLCHTFSLKPISLPGDLRTKDAEGKARRARSQNVSQHFFFSDWEKLEQTEEKDDRFLTRHFSSSFSHPPAPLETNKKHPTTQPPTLSQTYTHRERVRAFPTTNCCGDSLPLSLPPLLKFSFLFKAAQSVLGSRFQTSRW